MLRALLILCFALFSTSLASEEYVVGKNGGVFCEKLDDLEILVKAAVEKRVAPPMAPTCTLLNAGDRIEAMKMEPVGEGMQFGVGFAQKDRARKAGAFFAFLTQSSAAASPKPDTPSSLGRTYRQVDPQDVRNSPNRWANRDLEFRNVNVYWVDDDDVRIVTAASLTLFASSVRAMDADKRHFSTVCETQRNALSGQCKATVRFRYSDHNEDNPSGLSKRTTLRSADVELIRVGRRR